MVININFDYSKVKGSTQLHEKFKKEFIITVSKMFPDVIVLPYDVLKARAFANPEIIVTAGMKGVLDTVVLGNGWYLFFDMKTGKNTLQDNQKAFIKRTSEVNKKQVAFKINSVSEGIMKIREFNG